MPTQLSPLRLFSTSGPGHRSGVPLRLRLRPLVAGGDGLASALTAAFGDSSSEHDHSPGSLPVAGSPVATPTALPRSRRRRLLPPLPACRLRSPPTPARRPVPLVSKGDAQTPLGCQGSLSLHRSRIPKCAKPFPCGLPHDSTYAGWRSAARAPRPVRASRSASLSTLRDGADGRHPSGAVDLTVRLGLGSAWRGPPRCALVGALQNKESYELD